MSDTTAPAFGAPELRVDGALKVTGRLRTRLITTRPERCGPGFSPARFRTP